MDKWQRYSNFPFQIVSLVTIDPATKKKQQKKIFAYKNSTVLVHTYKSIASG